MLCSSPSSAKPCLPAVPQQATPAASAFLGAGGSLGLLSPHLPAAEARPLCAELRGLPCLRPPWALGDSPDSPASPVAKRGRQLSLVPTSGWGSRGSRPPQASHGSSALTLEATRPAPPPGLTHTLSDRTTKLVLHRVQLCGAFPAEAVPWGWEGPILPVQNQCPSPPWPAPPTPQPCPTWQPGLRGSQVLPPLLLPFLYW